MKKKMRKKYERKGPTIKEKFDEVNRLLANTEHRSVEAGIELKRIEIQNSNLRKTIDAQATELAILRETNLNLVEALNVLGRASRLEVQSKLWNNYDMNTQLKDCVAAKPTDLNNYFDANE